jgi:uncharacterized protein
VEQAAELPETQRGWAVVTGASSGLGREFALALTAHGYPVLAVARRAERLRVLANEIARHGGRLEPVVADLSTAGGSKRCSPGHPSARLSCSLTTPVSRPTALSPRRRPPECERDLVRLNVEALVALTRGLLPAMVERRRGGVINVASQMAFQPMPYFAVYAASKAFVLSFSEALAEELRHSGVCVTAIAPSFVRTEFTEVADSHAPERRFPHLEAEQVVAKALHAHEQRKSVKVVGSFYVFLTFAGRFAPGAVLARMMGRVLQPTALR